MSLREALEYHDAIYENVKSFCRPLKDNYGIPIFGYSKVFYDSNRYIMLMNDKGLAHDLLTIVKNSSIFAKTRLLINKSTTFQVVLWPDKPSGTPMEIYFNHSYWNGMSLMRSNKKSFETFFFVANKNNTQGDDLYIKNIEHFINFANQFEFFMLPKLPKVKKESMACFQNGFDYSLPPPTRYLKNTPSTHEKINTKPLIRVKGILISLPPRAYQCLRLLAHGNTSKDIANILMISYKTVEAHIANLKELTGYSRKSDLTKLYWDNTGYSVL